MRPWFLSSLVGLVTLLLDQLTKWWVVLQALPYRVNTGGSFGLFERASWIQGLAHWGLVLLLVYWWRRRKSLLYLEAIALGLLIGGGLGNGIDRLRLGGVVDFIDVWGWPTFNLADMAISAAAALLLYEILLQKRYGQ